jgi:hypothetical protein
MIAQEHADIVEALRRHDVDRSVAAVAATSQRLRPLHQNDPIAAGRGVREPSRGLTRSGGATPTAVPRGDTS